MGKVRVSTIGDEQLEEQQKKGQEARRAAKRKEELKQAAPEERIESTIKGGNKQPVASKYAQKVGTSKMPHTHSQNYLSVATKVDKMKVYSLKEALRLLPDLKRAHFDETVELHLNTIDKGISGSVTLPHGTGKEVKVVIATDAVIAEIEKGNINFDILVAEPTMMPKLARVAKILGPRGLMPNPKNGTVSPKPEDVAKKFQSGQVNFKTEAKFPLLHLAVGKVSFGEEKLSENISTIISAVQVKNIKNATLKSTMSPGIKVDVTSI